MISHLVTESCKFSAIKSTLDWVSRNQGDIPERCVRLSASCPCHVCQEEDRKRQPDPASERLRRVENRYSCRWTFLPIWGGEFGTEGGKEEVPSVPCVRLRISWLSHWTAQILLWACSIQKPLHFPAQYWIWIHFCAMPTPACVTSTCFPQGEKSHNWQTPPSAQCRSVFAQLILVPYAAAATCTTTVS